MRVKRRIDSDVYGFDPNFELTVTAKRLDPTGVSFNTSSRITLVYVDDVNDNQPSFEHPAYEYIVEEGFWGSYLPGSDIVAYDPDLVGINELTVYKSALQLRSCSIFMFSRRKLAHSSR